MLSIESEIAALSERSVFPPEVARVLAARERREVFSVYPELRTLAWLGAMLIATGVGIVIKNNFDRIRPPAISAAIGIASAACYAYAFWQRRENRAADTSGNDSSSSAVSPRSTFVADSLLLLGALLLSADIAYSELQFRFLGDNWPRQFLLVAVVHALGAYYFDSRALLTLSLSAFAAWLGIDRRAAGVWSDPEHYSLRAFLCAGVILLWRLLDGRIRASRTFENVFEHFAASLALWGGLLLTIKDSTRPAGVALTVVLAAVVMAHGFRQRSESFVLYGYVSGVIALEIGIGASMNGETSVLATLFVVTIVAIAGLFLLHARFRRMS